MFLSSAVKSEGVKNIASDGCLQWQCLSGFPTTCENNNRGSKFTFLIMGQYDW